MSYGISMAERGLMPDPLIRLGIRRLLRLRLRELEGDNGSFVAGLRNGPVAVDQDAANRQHYTVPTDFYRKVLGRRLKYSGSWWDETVRDLDGAEEAMLARYVERGELEDGQQVLDVGCGWGSLSLYLAGRFPGSRITALSNSPTQREHIELECGRRGFRNLSVITADLADWTTGERFDRLVSIECLEHMRNHAELFRRFAGWLEPDGRAFIHVFCHRRHCYPFETAGDDDWMARHFFTGGMMPSFDLFRSYDDALRVDEQWAVDGKHYARTSRAWLDRLDAARDEILALFTRDLGTGEGRRQLQRWRIFFMACEELFGYAGGDEWLVGHYRLRHV